MALDLPSILNASFGSSNYYKLANQIEVPNLYYMGVPAQNTSIPKPEYAQNVTGANALLDQAGFKADSSGNRFSLSLVSPAGGIGSAGTGPTLKMEQLIQAGLANVGITLRITVDDTTTYNNDVFGAKPPKDWNLAMSIISESADPDVPALYMLDSANGNGGAGGFDAGGFNDSTYNNMVLQEENTTAVGPRITILQNIGNYVHQQLPLLELYYQIEVVAWTNNFQGFTLGLGNPWHDYWGAMKSQSLAQVSMVVATTSSLITPSTTSTSASPSSTPSTSVSVVSSTVLSTTTVQGATSISTATVVVTTSASSSSSSSNTLIIAAVVVVIVIIVAAIAAMAMRRRGGAATPMPPSSYTSLGPRIVSLPHS